MDMADLIGLIGIFITSVVGPWILYRQKASDNKANQSADIHVSNAQALSALVHAVESLHSKLDSMLSRPCDGSAHVTASLGEILHQIQRDVDVIRDRGTR